MKKNLTPNQLLLIGIAAVVLLVAAFSLYLLQNPSGPLPFAPASATSSQSPPLPTHPPALQASDTPIPTRQTSYTPFVTRLSPTKLTAVAGSYTLMPNPSQTTLPAGATPSATSTRSATPIPSGTSSFTLTPTSPVISLTPTVTDTLAPGETGVIGLVLRNGIAVPNVTVAFKDDVDARDASTNQAGHYWFTTLAPGSAFSLTFKQSDNPQLTPPAEITSLAKIEGNMPTGVHIIDLPDLEVSLNQDGSLFKLQSPNDGAAVSASIISSSDPLPFVWADYTTGGTYRIELGPNGNDQPIWTITSINSPSYAWDGTLNDGTHVKRGNYWWRVAATKTVNGYLISIYTQPYDLLVNP